MRCGTVVAWMAAIALVSGCDLVGSAGPTTTVRAGALEANAVVEHVVDGDTVDLRFGSREERVRLIGIDTPETWRDDAEVECFGPEATAHLAALLPVGTAVRVERDIVDRDDYGRLLGYVYRADDGVFVNYELVRGGFATPLSIRPNTALSDLFVDAARAAEADDAGLWSACRE